MDTESYQGRIRARRAEWASLSRQERRGRLIEKARARSARRWADDEARADQQRRAGRLQLVLGGAEAETEAAL